MPASERQNKSSGSGFLRYKGPAMFRPVFFLCVVITMGAIAPACGGGTTPTNYPDSPRTTKSATLGPGDVIDVRVFYGSKELNRGYRIAQDGSIAFPYIGRVETKDRSQSDVEKDIQTRLADGYLNDPIVSIDIKEYNSRKIAVFGQVKSPGTQTYYEGMSILEAISQAGGFNPMAKANAVTVTRSVDGEQRKYTVPVGAIAENKAKPFAVRPGDAIFVPERLF